MWAPAAGLVAAALDHAADCQPNECCGAIAGGIYRRLVNRGGQGDYFALPMRDFVVLDRQFGVEAIVHSHVKQPPFPSELDRINCEKLTRPWLIVSWPSAEWFVLEPSGWKPPLVGRAFAWGACDCFSAVRDGLKHYAGITIPDFERDWGYWQNGQDLIGDNFAAAGFVQIDPAQPIRHLDVIAMKFSGKVANHLALFLAPDLILHHPAGGLSQRQLYDGLYQRATVGRFRHRSFVDG